MHQKNVPLKGLRITLLKVKDKKTLLVWICHKIDNVANEKIVYYVPRRTMRVIA